MPKKVQKKTSPAPETKKRPVAREEVLKDDEDEESTIGSKLANDDAISPDALEAALDSEDSYEADMDAEKDWE